MIFAPTFILFYGFDAGANLPTSAVISEVENRAPYFVEIIPEFRGANPARNAEKNSTVAAYKEKVTIPNNDLSHAHVNYYKNKSFMGLIGEFGPDNQVTSYIFACVVRGGQSRFGWGSGVLVNGKACKFGIEVQDDSKKRSWNPYLESYAARPKALRLTQQNTSLNDVARYCGAVSDVGEGWEFSVSRENWIDIFSPNSSPCRKALQLCESSTGSQCSAATQGEWFLNDESRLTAVLHCDHDRSFTRRNLSGGKVAASLRELRSAALADLKISRSSNETNAVTCAPIVLNRHEVVVAPYGEEATQVRVKVKATEVIIIDTLAGAVIVRSAADPEGKLLLKDESYVYYIPRQVSSILPFDSPERQAIQPNTNPPQLECDNFFIRGNPEANKFVNLCAQVNTAQEAPSWQKFLITYQQNQAFLKQVLPNQKERTPPNYASLYLPPDWNEYKASSLTDAPLELAEKFNFIPSQGNPTFLESSDFVAYNESPESTRLLYVVRTRLPKKKPRPESNEPGLSGSQGLNLDSGLNLDKLIGILQQLEQPISGNSSLRFEGFETIRRVNLADGEGLETIAFSTIEDVRVEVLTYYLIQGDYLYFLFMETYGEKAQQDDAKQELKKIAQSFRLLP